VISIRFSKPRRDGSVLTSGDFLVAAPQLRRSRALFPCVDGPVYYEPGAAHVAPHTFDLAITVAPTDVAVASGALLQQTHGVEAAADGGAGGAAPRVVARTFHYAVDAPTLPEHLLIAVGPFEVVPAQTLFGAAAPGGRAGGTGVASAAAAAVAGPPIITAFYPSSGAGAKQQEQQERLNNGQEEGAAALAALSLAGANASAAGVTPAAVLATLRPLALIFRQCEKHLGCRAPFTHLQVRPCWRGEKRW